MLSMRLTRFIARTMRIRPARLQGRRPVASITFDDFPKSAWEIGGPVLARHKARGTYYTAGNFCGRTVKGTVFYDEADLRALAAAGHEIACHGYGHEPSDVGRFLRGKSAERPAVPENYFDRATELALAALETGAEDSAWADYNEIISGALPLQSWHGHTIKLFGNWLAMIAAEKVRRLVQSQPPQRKKRRA
jgi:hypothetical protein